MRTASSCEPSERISILQKQLHVCDVVGSYNGGTTILGILANEGSTKQQLALFFNREDADEKEEKPFNLASVSLACIP